MDLRFNVQREADVSTTKSKNSMMLTVIYWFKLHSIECCQKWTHLVAKIRGYQKWSKLKTEFHCTFFLIFKHILSRVFSLNALMNSIVDPTGTFIRLICCITCCGFCPELMEAFLSGILVVIIHHKMIQKHWSISMSKQNYYSVVKSTRFFFVVNLDIEASLGFLQELQDTLDPKCFRTGIFRRILRYIDGVIQDKIPKELSEVIEKKTFVA